jgi:putative intracellular protease/amidase
MLLVTKSKPLSEVKASDFDAVLLPGGHGVCWDLPDHADLIAQLSAAYQAGKVVAALCHGPCGLVNVKDAAGAPIVKGKKVTGFTNEEEIAVGKHDVVPFMLETKLKELGGDYSCGDSWAPFAVRDGNLVTGQNPASGAETARLVIEALSS